MNLPWVKLLSWPIYHHHQEHSWNSFRSLNGLTMRVHFVLIGEGSSDESLILHLENLCIDCGAKEVTGIAPDLRRLPYPVGHSVEEKLRTILRLEPTANLIFIHRDADSRDAQPRHAEIAKAVNTCQVDKAWVAIVPVQETEAWLLLDELAIKQVAGKPNSPVKLRLPSATTVEALADPKAVLQQALITSSGAMGRRLERLRADFALHRKLLLLRLPIVGPLTQVPSWGRMRTDLEQTIEKLEANPANKT